MTWWWVTGGGITQLGGWATGLESVGRITGLASAVLLLAQVVLMARVPVLERAFGQDELARIHRLVGFTSFNLMLAHIVTITWGYAAGSLTATPRTLWDLVVNYPGMLLATAATACLVMVVVTSIRAARRRLRYESWHLMHLYAYLGVGLAIPHQLWTGADFTSSTGRQVFWWTAWIVAAGSVLVWRVGLPLWRNLRHDLRVAAVVPEGDGTVSVHVTGRALHRLPVEAGQFFTWRFGGRPGRSRAQPLLALRRPRRPVAADHRPGRRRRQRRGGRPRGRLPRLGRGPVRPAQPARPRAGTKVLLIGAGVGITPLRALAEGLEYAPGEALAPLPHVVRPALRRRAHALARRPRPRRLGPPRAPARAGLLARRRRRRPHRPGRPHVLGPRRRRARRLPLRPRPGPTSCSATSAPPACPSSTSIRDLRLVTW